jgi:hypothetical protein
MSEYDLTDTGGLEMLAQACEAQDCIGRLRAEINTDGEVIRARGSIKEHPLLKHELAYLAFIVRTLAKLGLNFEAVKPSVGQPGGGIGWKPPT